MINHRLDHIKHIKNYINGLALDLQLSNDDVKYLNKSSIKAFAECTGTDTLQPYTEFLAPTPSFVYPLLHSTAELNTLKTILCYIAARPRLAEHINCVISKIKEMQKSEHCVDNNVDNKPEKVTKTPVDKIIPLELLHHYQNIAKASSHHYSYLSETLNDDSMASYFNPNVRDFDSIQTIVERYK